MSFGLRTVTREDLFNLGETSDCPCCAQPLRREKSRGPLTWRARPDELFWHGMKMMDITATEARLVSLLIRRRCCDYTTMTLALPSEEGTEASLMTLICRVRKKLKKVCGKNVEIRNIYGFGYDLEVKGE